MTQKQKPVEIEVSGEIEQAVLSLPVRRGETLTTVGDLVHQAREALEIANHAIHNNALVQLTADQLMKTEKRRGMPALRVHLDGTVILHVSYGSSVPPVPLRPTNSPKKLPSIDDIRAEALELGVDVSDLGRQKLAMLERLQKAREALSEMPPDRLRDEVQESPLGSSVSLPR